MGSGKNQFLPFLKLNEWQELVLAISKASRDRAERVIFGEWQELVLAIFKFW